MRGMLDVKRALRTVRVLYVVGIGRRILRSNGQRVKAEMQWDRWQAHAIKDLITNRQNLCLIPMTTKTRSSRPCLVVTLVEVESLSNVLK